MAREVLTCRIERSPDLISRHTVTVTSMISVTSPSYRHPLSNSSLLEVNLNTLWFFPLPLTAYTMNTNTQPLQDSLDQARVIFDLVVGTYSFVISALPKPGHWERTQVAVELDDIPHFASALTWA